jgi:hypothetical protein
MEIDKVIEIQMLIEVLLEDINKIIIQMVK